MRTSRFVRAKGFRSGLEVVVNKQLKDSGISYSYEGELNTVRYILPESRHRYLCDFLLGNGVMIESKGLFTSDDRKKHIHIKQQWPMLDIRFLFSRSSSRLSKSSKTTYAAWCEKNGFKYCDREIPKAWLKETKPKAELELIISTLKGFKK